MSNKIADLLSSPFPQMEKPWKLTLYTALIIAVIFFLFQPFAKINNNNAK